jgi:hypothetical protein
MNSAVRIHVLARMCALLACATLPACPNNPCPASCPAQGIPLTNATTGAGVCDATVLQMLPDGGTTTVPVFDESGTPIAADDGGDSGPSGACVGPYFFPSITPGESATVTISATGFDSTTVTITYAAAPGECCPEPSPGKVALVPQ